MSVTSLAIDEYYLQLSDNPIRFDAVSQLTNVFFDDTNGQVFAVRSSGVTGVIVKGPDQNSSTTFRMEDKGPVISIKFSPDLSILAIQRSHTLVDFMNFDNLLPTSAEYSQSSKWKNGSILGFVWTKPNEIVFISDHGIEILKVFPEKKQLKSFKAVSINSIWFQWCAKSKLVLLASANGVCLNPFSVDNSVITKLPRVERSQAVNERDVNCVRLYESSWCLILKHGGECPAEVIVYPLEPVGHSLRTHILRTGLVGRFAINLVDDLIVVHHQDSKTSVLFDIMEDGVNEGGNILHTPIAPPKSLKPVMLADQPCQMYSSNWVVFQPDIVIDARLGSLWKVTLKPTGLLCAPPGRIVGILLRRTEGREPIFSILQDLITEGGKNLAPLMEIFDQINAVYRKWAEQELSKQTGQSSQFADFNSSGSSSSKSSAPYVPHRIVISQQDIYTYVLQHHTDSQHIVQVVVTYLCSLARHRISPQHALTEMLVRALVKADRFSDLHQLLQYGAIGDSKPLACLLLSLANMHPAAHQLALDMLHRLNAHEEVVEVLLGGGEVIGAVGVAKQYSAGYPQVLSQIQTGMSSVWNSLPARKLLSAAQGDVNTFVSVYHALENRNRITRNTHCFFKGEQCDSFVQIYLSLFPEFIDR